MKKKRILAAALILAVGLTGLPQKVEAAGAKGLGDNAPEMRAAAEELRDEEETVKPAGEAAAVKQTTEKPATEKTAENTGEDSDEKHIYRASGDLVRAAEEDLASELGEEYLEELFRAAEECRNEDIPAEEEPEEEIRVSVSPEEALKDVSPEEPVTDDSLMLKPNTYHMVHRLLNPETGAYFYTRVKDEIQEYAEDGWEDQGIAWYSPGETMGGLPVFGIYNTVTEEYYYSKSLNEIAYIYKNTQFYVNVEPGEGGYYVDGRGEIIGKAVAAVCSDDRNIVIPWRKDGACWTSADGMEGAVPVYCVFNPLCPTDKPGSHYYTTSRNEVDALVKNGWTDNGIVWYAVPDQSWFEQQRAVKPVVTMEEDDAYASIEALVNLKDTRNKSNGIVAKVVMASGWNGAAASLCVQYEKNIDKGYSQFPDKTVLLMENVYSNPLLPGNDGKHYIYLDEAKLDQTYKLRLSWTKEDNRLHAYVNDEEISYGLDPFTETLFKPPFSFQVEAAGAQDGDIVDATFKDIRVRVGDGTEEYPVACGTEADWFKLNYFGLTADLLDPGTKGPDKRFHNDMREIGYKASARIYGTVDMNTKVNGKNSQLGKPWDWDTCFSAVEPLTGRTGLPCSGVVLINQQQTDWDGWVPDEE